MKFTSSLLALLLMFAPMSMDVAALAQTSAPGTETPVLKSKSELSEGQKLDKARKLKAKSGQGRKDSLAEDRWKKKTEEERRTLLVRFEQLKKLSTEDREVLRQRAGELADQRRSIESTLESGVRSNLDSLPPHERDRILREHQVAELRRAGEELREALDAGPREILEDLIGPRGGPPRPFHKKRDELRGTFSDKAVKRFGELGHLTPDEHKRLLGLPEPERIHEALLIKRNRIEEVIGKLGLPEGVSQKKWQKMLEEPSTERFLKQARKRGFDQHLGPGRPDHPEPGGRKGLGDPDTKRRPKGGLDGEKDSSRLPSGTLGPRGGPKSGSASEGNKRPGGDKAKSDRSGGDGESRGLRDLADVLRPTLEDRLAISELAEGDRQQAMSKRLQKRAAAFLEGHAILTDQERQALNRLSADAYVEFLAELVHERRGLGSRGSRDRGRGKRDESGRGKGGGPRH